MHIAIELTTKDVPLGRSGIYVGSVERVVDAQCCLTSYPRCWLRKMLILESVSLLRHRTHTHPRNTPSTPTHIFTTPTHTSHHHTSITTSCASRTASGRSSSNARPSVAVGTGDVGACPCPEHLCPPLQTGFLESTAAAPMLASSKISQPWLA